MGEVFAGRYELVDLLATGGMGSVWRVWDRRERTYRAAKVLRQSDAASLLRFVREQSFRVEHPHVVAPLGWAGEDDRVLFTMDLVRGGSVATLCGDFGALPEGWVAVLLDQLLAGLEAVHAAGLVHRDITPANLLLAPTGRARPHLFLSDFGIAVQVDAPRLTRASQVLGTPGYLAPEQLLGGDPSPRSDLYACGMVAVELLTAERPDSSGATAGASLDACAGSLAPVLHSLVSGAASERFASATAARAALAAIGAVPSWEEPPSDGGVGIEVLDHCPALPEGWGPQGPRPRPAVAAVRLRRRATAASGRLPRQVWVAVAAALVLGGAGLLLTALVLILAG